MKVVNTSESGPLSGWLSQLSADHFIDVEFIQYQLDATELSFLKDSHRALAIAGLQTFERMIVKLHGPNHFQIKRDARLMHGCEVVVDVFLAGYRAAFDYWHSQKPDRDRDKLFSEVNTFLFGDLSAYSYYEWSTDWTNFFDQGHEGHCAYLWTMIASSGKAFWVAASLCD